MLQVVAEREQHAVARSDAEPAEPQRRGGRATVQLGVGEPPPAVDDSLGVGSAERCAPEELAERHETRRTFPLFLRSSTYCTAARAS